MQIHIIHFILYMIKFIQTYTIKIHLVQIFNLFPTKEGIGYNMLKITAATKAWFPYDRPNRPDRPSRLKKNVQPIRTII